MGHALWLALVALGLSALTVLAQDVPMGALYGHITDQNGNPVSGATIVVADVPDAVATTGDDGGYGIALPAGDHGIAVISPVVSDQVVVSVPAGDAAFADIGLFIPPPAPPDIPTATSTPIPEQPTSTPTPIPPAEATATPTQTQIPTASLSGSVKNPDGSQPIPGTTVLVTDLPIFSASTGTGGAYSLSGLPYGRHFVVATDPLGAVSDSYQIPVSGDTVLNINLQRFPAGQPTLFIGHVLSRSNSVVAGATVWRMGGAGLTTSGGDGTFRLVDASRGSTDPNSTQLGPAPDTVVFIAVKDDNWGMLRVDTHNPGRIEIKLDQHGPAPSGPAATKFSSGMSVGAHGDQYFTARWASGQNLSGPTIHIKGSQGFESFTGAVQGGACVGDCGNATNQIVWLVAKLPRGQDVKLDLQDSSGNPWSGNPNWDDAQVVRLSP